jgi:hypothetical protein
VAILPQNEAILDHFLTVLAPFEPNIKVKKFWEAAVERGYAR